MNDMSYYDFWSNEPAGPCLIIADAPDGSSAKQIRRGLDAAHAVFEAAGVDPVEAAYPYSADRKRNMHFRQLWKAAENAATIACWAPRENEPERVVLDIFAT